MSDIFHSVEQQQIPELATDEYGLIGEHPTETEDKCRKCFLWNAAPVGECSGELLEMISDGVLYQVCGSLRERTGLDELTLNTGYEHPHTVRLGDYRFYFYAGHLKDNIKFIPPPRTW